MVKLPAPLPTRTRYCARSLASLQARTNASAYVLEQRVQKQYRTLLFDGLERLYGLPGPQALDHLLETAFPTYFSRDDYNRRCQQYWQAEERVQHDVPEVIRRLPAQELRQVADLLAEQDLVGAIQLVWFTFRPRLRFLDPPDLLPEDSKQHQAAGLGRLPRAPRIAVAKAYKRSGSRPAEVATPSPGEIIPAVQAHLTDVIAPTPRRSRPHYQVKRAQERKRLKRKRR